MSDDDRHYLAIDASDRTASVCLIAPGTTYRDQSDGGAAEQLPALLQSLLHRVNADRTAASQPKLGWHAIDCCACATGPGSQIGIRAAISVARSLALAANLPLMPVSRFEALSMAPDLDGGQPFTVAVPGGRRMVAVQRFAGLFEPEGTPDLIDAATFEARLAADQCLGQLVVDRYLDRPSGIWVIDSSIDAGYVALSAKLKHERGMPFVQREALKPVYLQPVDARPNAGRPLVSIDGHR